MADATHPGWVRHFNFIGYVASDGGASTWDASSLWYEDTTWSVATALS
jgi:hypothetical protein